MVQIEILTGPESGRVVDVASGVRTLGRAATCDVALKDGSISGRHLELQVGEDGGVRFRDLGSTNGTWSGGVQVQDGEWFPGSELKLGGCVMRLVDPAAVADDDGDGDDAELHRRAREAALSGGRKGGPLQLVLAVVLVLGGGGAAWWFFGGGSGADGEGDGARRGPGGGGAEQVRFDLIDNLGDFGSPESWNLGGGATIADGTLRAGDGGGRATLTRSFPAVAALRIEAEAGSGVVPHVAWGAEGGEAALGEWAAAPLGGGAVELALPAEAAWFRLSLELAPGATVAGLSVDEGTAQVARGSAPGGSVATAGGNWLLSDERDKRLVVRGASGTWEPLEGGYAYRADGPATLLFSASPALLGDGGFAVLASGGPVGLAGGVVVEDSPGLLLGSELGRYLVRFDAPAKVVAAEGGARVELQGGATLRWELREDLTEAARIARAIKDAERARDDRALLQEVARLLREYPLVDAQVADAIGASRASLERGRRELQALQTSTAAALFIASLQAMESLQAEAAALVARYPGTELESGAQELVDVLAARAAEIHAEQEAEEAEYRGHLMVALQQGYPLLAAWLEGTN